MLALRRVAPDVLAAIFLVSGLTHLVRPSFYDALIPPFMPVPGAIIAVSGVAEIACAIALIRRVRWAGPASAVLLVAVFPGNVWFAAATSAASGSPPWLTAAAWLRLPLQLPLIWAALQAGDGRSRRAGIDAPPSRRDNGP